MYRSRLATVAVGGLLCLRCIDGPSLGPRPAPPEVLVTPTRAEGSARVVRLEVRVAQGPLPDPGELWLFSGALSDYHVGRIARGELPDTLVARQVPVVSWCDASCSVSTVAPSVVLEPGARYTLAAPGFGRLVEFVVASEDVAPLLERVWPPRGSRASALLVLCGESVPAATLELELEPRGAAAQLEPDLGVLANGPPCVSLRLSALAEEPGTLVLPAEVSGFLLDPEPIELGPTSAVVATPCAADELEFGPGCARVDDDRLSVRSAEEPLLWVMTNGSPARIEVSGPAGRWLVRELEPDKEQGVSGRAIGVAGVEMPFDLRVHTLPERAHLVLNEVLFNPAGAEPAGEWVEVVNDGRGPATLAGIRLRDSAGAVELPAAALGAGEYLLLVRDDFPAPSGADVAPSAGTELVHLPSLAKGGLSNTGELLQLEDASGASLSRFPSLASRRAGKSLARARPDAFDDDLGAFGEHAPPGASPGAPNVLVTPEP